MKRRVMLFLAMISMVTFMMTPIVSQAVTTANYTDDGYLSDVTIDGTTYYDIYGGSEDNRENTEDPLIFLREVLTKPYKSEGSLLDYWSQMAFLILQDNEKYSADIRNTSSEDFAKELGQRGPNSGKGSGYTDIVYGLSYTGDAFRKGSKGKDNTWYSGLTTAGSLSDVRTAMGQSIKNGIGKKANGAKFLQPESAEYLADLKSDSKDKVYYNLITCVDRDGASTRYFYNSYGIAFYDFKVGILADKGIKYKTAADGYTSLEAAAEAEPGVTYKSSGGGEGTVSYFENSSKESMDISREFNQSESVTLSNSVETTKSYTFTQTIGSDTEFEATLPLVGKATETISLEISAEEAYSQAVTTGKEIEKSSSNSVTIGASLPAQTAAAVETKDEEVTIVLDYDAPIVVTYKVAIFAIQGDYFDDGVTYTFQDAGTQQGYFSTIFGDAEGDAMTDLQKRAITYADNQGYEKSLGVTNGYVEVQGDGKDAYKTQQLDWKSILGGKVAKVPAEQTVRVNFYAVDDSGNADLSKTIANTVAKNEIKGGTVTATAAKINGYALYEGAVKYNTKENVENEQGNVENTDVTYDLYNGFSDTAKTQKTLTVGTAFDENSNKNTIDFYYKKNEAQTDASDATVTSTAPTLEPSTAVNSAVSGEITKNILQSADLVKWLGYHAPMSTTGATISYSSKSLSALFKSIVPLYPLSSIKLAGGQQDEYDVTTGDIINLSNIETEGYNKNSVGYYGFDSDKGHWIIVDENDNEITDTNIATIVTGISGSSKLIAGDYDGTVYLKYQIDDDADYTSKQDATPATNDSIGKNTAYVQVNISKIPFEGAVVATGTLTGYANDAAINLDGSDEVDGYVLDKTQKQINVPVSWEAQLLPSKGIKIEDNKLTFTKAGKYNIRATYKDQYSEWIEVTALAEKVLDDIQISSEGTVLADEYILHDGNDTYDLQTLLGGTLKAYDQYDNDWTALDNLAWYYAVDNETPAKAADGKMTVTKAGTYTIYAECDGVKSNEVTFTVKDARAINTLTISDDNDLLADYILNDGSDLFDLTTLTKSSADQYGQEWADYTNLKWYYVLGEAEPVEVAGGNLSVTEAGDYTIYAECDGVKSNELSLTVKEARKIASFSIKDTVVAEDYTEAHDYLGKNEYILGDGTDKFDFNSLLMDPVDALDQYGDAWTDYTGIKWYAVADGDTEEPKELTDGVLDVSALDIDEDVTYTIYAVLGDVTSTNTVELVVKPARELATITVDGEIPTLTTNETFNNHKFDLDDLTATGYDQYEDEFEIPDTAEWQIVSGEDYAELDGTELTGLVTGEGTVKLVAGDIESDEISFEVGVVPYIAELYCSTDADYIVEGEEFDLSDVTLSAKDQWNDEYVLSKDQIASVVWTLDTEHSTVDADDVTIADGKVTVKEGALDYADTLKLNLKATIPDRGDGNGPVAQYVEVQVRQQQILAEITIGLTDDEKVLKAEENSLIPEFFTISAKDQYGVDFEIKHADVEWASSNEDAYYIKNNAIYAKDPDAEAVITASTKNSLDETITSNEIDMAVPGIEKIEAIAIEDAPEAVAYGTVLDVADLTAKVTSNYDKVYTDEELAEYPAKITWSIKDDNKTGSKLDSSKGEITFGDKRGEMKIVAMVVNSSTDKIAETEISVFVGPYITAITPAKTSLSSTGGADTITITGMNLVEGMTVSAFDQNGDEVEGVTGTTTGTDVKQTVSLTFPANEDTENAVVYTVMIKPEEAAADYDAEPVATVTVNKASSYSGGGGGGGGLTVEYTITSTAGEGGTITETMKVDKGSNAEFVITPDKGYVIDKLVVDGKEVEAAGTYKFENVKANHTIDATFKADPNAAGFTDVDDDDWFAPSVDYVSKHGLMNGISDTEFGPSLNTTRGMIVTILYRLEGEPEAGAPVFQDVDASAYYAAAVAWANKNGIVKGYSAEAFGPEDNITREQMAAIMYRYSEFKGIDVSAAADISAFADGDSVSEYAVDAMKWACGEGLFKGNTENMLNPQGLATRAEVATILTRYCEKYAE